MLPFWCRIRRIRDRHAFFRLGASTWSLVFTFAQHAFFSFLFLFLHAFFFQDHAFFCVFFFFFLLVVILFSLSLGLTFMCVVRSCELWHHLTSFPLCWILLRFLICSLGFSQRYLRRGLDSLVVTFLLRFLCRLGFVKRFLPLSFGSLVSTFLLLHFGYHVFHMGSVLRISYFFKLRIWNLQSSWAFRPTVMVLIMVFSRNSPKRHFACGFLAQSCERWAWVVPECHTSLLCAGPWNLYISSIWAWSRFWHVLFERIKCHSSLHLPSDDKQNMHDGYLPCLSLCDAWSDTCLATMFSSFCVLRWCTLWRMRNLAFLMVRPQQKHCTGSIDFSALFSPKHWYCFFVSGFSTGFAFNLRFFFFGPCPGSLNILFNDVLDLGALYTVKQRRVKHFRTRNTLWQTWNGNVLILEEKKKSTLLLLFVLPLLFFRV